MNNSFKKLYYLASSIIGGLSFFIISKNATNSLSRDDFAELSIVISLCSIFATFILMGQSAAIAQIIFKENRNFGDFFIEFAKSIKIIFAVFIILFVGSFLLSPIIEQNLNFVIILLTALMMSINQFMQTVINNINLYISLLISNILIFLIAIASSFYEYSFYTYFKILGVSYFLSSTFLLSQIIIFFKKKNIIPFAKKGFNSFNLIKLGIFSTISALVFFVYHYVDRLLIGNLVSTLELSSYAVASLFSITFLNLISAGLIRPYIYDLKVYSKSNGVKNINYILRKLEIYAIFFILLLFFCNLYFVDYFVINFYDKRYTTVSDYIFILGAPVAINFFASCYSIMIAQKSITNLYLSFFSLFILLGILLNFLLISQVGIKGLGIGIFILGGISVLLSFFIIKSKLPDLYFVYKIVLLCPLLLFVNVKFF